MEKLKELYYRHLWLIVLAGILAVMASVYWIDGKYHEHKTDSQIRQTQTAAQTAVNVAIADEYTAANASAERKAEDDTRSRVITPKLDTARRNSIFSKTELEKAKEHFNEKADPQTLSSSWADNCDRLRRLWPDTRFEYCAASDTNAGK